MPDVGLVWGGDFTLTNAGDLALVSGYQLGNQRVVRRLLTSPNSYIWHAGYGAGVGAYVGTSVAPAQVLRSIRKQIFYEQVVARTPPPSLSTQSKPGGQLTVNIIYAMDGAAGPQLLAFDVNAPDNLTGISF